MTYIFSTIGLPEKDRFPRWGEVFISQTGYESVVENPDIPFYAKFWARSLGDAVLFQQEASAYTVLRGPIEIARTTKSFIVIEAILSGTFH